MNLLIRSLKNYFLKEPQKVREGSYGPPLTHGICYLHAYIHRFIRDTLDVLIAHMEEDNT
jgi:hypothetical protein